MGQLTIRKRVQRVMTARERARYERALAEVEAEKPEIIQRGRAVMEAHVKLQEILALLKERRQAIGMSMTQLQLLTGIDRARLSRLERDPNANPTVETVNRIAYALGVELRVSAVAVNGED